MDCQPLHPPPDRPAARFHHCTTAQNTRELWHCLEGLSIEPFDPDAANWIKHYPGGLKFAE
ncbi:hypothetical protein Dpoa2040_002892 [Dickeya sp. CFBP 2040]|uniref:hypothetical protein n=1 Tax=Dickeya sp. CFBP 2040 TaxID=2718531 RepID=UPI00144543D5|nr:hypothetical protein [Dickeya sp. CFBP 2040]NKI75596.1 hypothetical protein [Dickeya sp. CFBP 2040]